MPIKSASHAFAEGSPQFSWRVKAINDERGRYVCECKTHPGVVGFGDTEQSAINKAKMAMAKAFDSDTLPSPSPGAQPDPKA